MNHTLQERGIYQSYCRRCPLHLERATEKRVRKTIQRDIGELGKRGVISTPYKNFIFIFFIKYINIKFDQIISEIDEMSIPIFFSRLLLSLNNRHVSLLIPYISDTGDRPPESCVFSMLVSFCAAVRK